MPPSFPSIRMRARLRLGAGIVALVPGEDLFHLRRELHGVCPFVATGTVRRDLARGCQAVTQPRRQPSPRAWPAHPSVSGRAGRDRARPAAPSRTRPPQRRRRRSDLGEGRAGRIEHQVAQPRPQRRERLAGRIGAVEHGLVRHARHRRRGRRDDAEEPGRAEDSPRRPAPKAAARRAFPPATAPARPRPRHARSPPADRRPRASVSAGVAPAVDPSRSPCQALQHARNPASSAAGDGSCGSGMSEDVRDPVAMAAARLESAVEALVTALSRPRPMAAPPQGDEARHGPPGRGRRHGGAAGRHHRAAAPGAGRGVA